MGNGMETDGWWGGPEFGAFLARVDAELIPKIRATEAVISFVPDSETDSKYAVELGLAVALDKPIILLVRPGVKVSAKTARIADEIVEIDFMKPKLIRPAVIAAMDRLAERGVL